MCADPFKVQLKQVPIKQCNNDQKYQLKSKTTATDLQQGYY